MSLKTKLFGKKIGKQEIENLKEILKIEENFDRSQGGWSTGIYGKCRVIPKKEGLDIDLYIFTKDFHIVDGTLGGDEIYLKGETRTGNAQNFHYKKVIPYNKINSNN